MTIAILIAVSGVFAFALLAEQPTGILSLIHIWQTVNLLAYTNLGNRLQTYVRTSGGGGWIRTIVGVSQQIYSLPPLALSLIHILSSESDGYRRFRVRRRL